MSPTLFRIMLQYIRRRSIQSVLLIIGVMIGVAMMVAIDIANNSASKAFELSTESITGKTTHEITGGPNGLDEGLYTQIRTEIGWQNSAPIVTDYVVALELNKQPMRLFGIDPFAEPPFRNYINTENAIDTGTDEPDMLALGRFFIQPNTILIGEDLAKQYDIRPNDTLTLQYGDKTHTVTVIGLLRTSDSLARQALQGMVIADISTAQELLGMPGKLSRIDLIIDPDTSEGRTVITDIKAILPPGASLMTARARADAVGQLTDAFELNLTALSLLALVVGMFLVYNTVMFSVVQRRPVIGILRSIGVTRRQIFALVISEALLLSSIGALLGLGLGIILGRATVEVVTQSINDVFFTVTVQSLHVSAFTLIKGFVVGVGAALFAAFLPAYEATNTPPISASRRSDLEQRTLKIIPYITVAGIVMALAGTGLLRFQALLINFAGIFSIIIGLALLTALVVLWSVPLLPPVTGKLGGLVGRMAPRSILRNFSRTSVAIAALMLAVSVIVGVTIMVGSFRITVEDWLNQTLRADVFISPPNGTASQTDTPISRDLITRVEAVEGISRVVYTRQTEVAEVGDDRPVALSAIMSDIAEGRRHFVHQVDLSQAEIYERVVNGNALLMTEPFANSRGIQWRDDLTITLLTEQGPVEFAVLGIYQDYTTSQGHVTIGLETYRRLWNDDNITAIGAYVEPGADIDAVLVRLQNALSGSQLLIQSNRELRQSAMEVFDRTFAITGALNLLATVVAFIGILSALMALQLERRREIGIMRSNGLTQKQMLRLTLWETGIMGMVAGIMAMPVGLALAMALIKVINLRSFGWSMEMFIRWQFFAQAFAVAILAALLAGLYPAWRIGRIQPVEAIRSE